MSSSELREAASQSGKLARAAKFADERIRKQQEEAIDDWDADSASEPEGDRNSDPFGRSKEEWIKADTQEPSSMPVMSQQTRSLPPAAFGSGLAPGPMPSASASGRTIQGSVGPAVSGMDASRPAPPKILQRPKNVPPGMTSNSQGGSGANTPPERKTVEQRQEEYRLARARIFGSEGSTQRAQK